MHQHVKQVMEKWLESGRLQVVGGGGSAMFYISYIMHKTSRTWVVSCLKYAVRIYICIYVYITTYGLREVFLTIAWVAFDMPARCPACHVCFIRNVNVSKNATNECLVFNLQNKIQVYIHYIK